MFNLTDNNNMLYIYYAFSDILFQSAGKTC